MVTKWIDGPKVIFDVRRADNLKALFKTRHPNYEQLLAYFHVGQNSTGLKAVIANLRRATSTTLRAEFIIRHPGTGTLKGILIVRHSASATLLGKSVIRHPDNLALRAEFRITVEGWEMQGLDAAVYRDLGVIS